MAAAQDTRQAVRPKPSLSVYRSLFVEGVVTGTILSFEMGLLWPAFTSTFGSVFGFRFAIEGFSTPFFLEAIFIGIYVYGWDRLSPRLHFLSGVANRGGRCARLADGDLGQRVDESPAGFTLVDGKVTDAHPFQALFANGYFWHELVHMYLAGYMVTGFLVAGCYAIGPLRGQWGRCERIALSVPLTAAAVASPLQVLVGDWAARDVAANQPIKLAALEGIGQDQGRAPEHYSFVRQRPRREGHRDPAAVVTGLPQHRMPPSRD